MKAIVLGAGEGRRMGNHTLELPKPFLSVGGRTLFEHQLKALAPVCDEVLIAVGYGCEDNDVQVILENHVSVPESLTIETLVVDEWDDYENSWTCYQALNSEYMSTGEHVLLLCGDIVIEPHLLADFTATFERSLDPSYSYVLTIEGVQDEHTAVLWDEDMRITDYGAIEGHREAGVFLLNETHIETARRVLEQRRDDWFPIVFEEVDSKPYLIDEDRHTEINTPEDLKRAKESLPFGLAARR